MSQIACSAFRWSFRVSMARPHLIVVDVSLRRSGRKRVQWGAQLDHIGTEDLVGLRLVCYGHNIGTGPLACPARHGQKNLI